MTSLIYLITCKIPVKAIREYWTCIYVNSAHCHSCRLLLIRMGGICKEKVGGGGGGWGGMGGGGGEFGYKNIWCD